jgi:hypothetical protein
MDLLALNVILRQPACQEVPASTLPNGTYGENGELEESGMPQYVLD